MKLAQYGAIDTVGIASQIDFKKFSANATVPKKASVPESYSRMLAQGVETISDAAPIAVPTPHVALPQRISVAPIRPEIKAAALSAPGKKVEYNISPTHRIPEDVHGTLNRALDRLTHYKSSAAVLTSIDQVQDPRQLMVTAANLQEVHGRDKAIVPKVKNNPQSDLALVLDVGVVRDSDQNRLLMALHDLLMQADFELRGIPTGPFLLTGKNTVPLLGYELTVRQKQDAFRRELGIESQEELSYAMKLVDDMLETGGWNRSKERNTLLNSLSPEVAAQVKNNVDGFVSP